MGLRTSDVVPISEARARLTELAEEVVNGGAEKVLTKNGASYVAIVDAKNSTITIFWRRNMPGWCCWTKQRPDCGRFYLANAFRPMI